MLLEDECILRSFSMVVVKMSQSGRGESVEIRVVSERRPEYAWVI